MSKISKDNNNKRGLFQAESRVRVKCQERKVFKGTLILCVCIVACVGDHRTGQGWRWTGMTKGGGHQSWKAEESDRARSGFPKRNAFSQESVKSILTWETLRVAIISQVPSVLSSLQPVVSCHISN